MLKYIIETPSYEPKSAGIWVLHKLCHDLNGLYPNISYISSKRTKTNPQWNTPICQHNVANESIIIYPESFTANGSEYCGVVRYIINKPGTCPPRTEPLPANDFHLSFSKIFFKSPDHVLFMPHLRDDIFFNKGKKRQKICWYEGKATHHYNNYPSKFYVEKKLNHSAHILIPNNHSMSLEELATLFNESELFICYDNMTAMFKLAVLCGCPTVIIPGKIFTKEDFEKSEWGLNGIAWGYDKNEIEIAKQTVKNGADWYKHIKEKYPESLKCFVNKTQKKYLNKMNREGVLNSLGKAN